MCHGVVCGGSGGLSSDDQRFFLLESFLREWKDILSDSFVLFFENFYEKGGDKEKDSSKDTTASSQEFKEVSCMLHQCDTWRFIKVIDKYSGQLFGLKNVKANY